MICLGQVRCFFFILVSVACMATYDPRFVLAIGLFSIYLFNLANICWRDISFVVKIIGSIALLIYLWSIFSHLVMVKKFMELRQLLLKVGAFLSNQSGAFLPCKSIAQVFSTVPLAILFLMTTHPSQFAASLNQIGVPYKFAYSVSLTLRYIPDVQEEFFTIRKAQEARGLNLSQKADWSNVFVGISKLFFL